MSRMSILVLAVLAVLWLAVGNIRNPLPPTRVVIQAGPPTGSFAGYAQHYADHMKMKPRGLNVDVAFQNDSLKIIDMVAAGRDDVQVGFTAQRVLPASYPHLVSLGVVDLQPLFLFLRRDVAGSVHTLSDLAGRRLVMPVENSATEQATRELLALYGVTSRNARFAPMDMDLAAAALQRGEQDAGFFMLASGNPLVSRLAADPNLALFSYGDSTAIARHVDFLKPATLVRGAFDLRAMLPPRDVTVVGASVNVVVRDDIQPAVLYALLQAMAEVHKGQTLVSDPGEYPHQAGAALPLHPLAEEWAKSGTPWLFSHLPLRVASVMDAYWAPALVLLTIVSAFGTLESLNSFIDGIVFSLARRLLGWLQWRVTRGAHPGLASRLLFRTLEPLILRQDEAQSARAMLEHLRPRILAS